MSLEGLSKRGGILALFFIIVSCAVLADTLLDEDFSYSDAYELHGWQYTGLNPSADNETPTNITIFSPTNNLGFGQNWSGSEYGSSFNKVIRRDLLNYSHRTVTVTYSYYHNLTNNMAGSWTAALRLSPTKANTDHYIEIRHLPPSEGNKTQVYAYGLLGFSTCITDTVHYSANSEYELQVDFIAGVYNFYQDGILKCVNSSAGNAGDYSWQGLNLFHQVPNDGFQNFWIDDIIIINSSSGLSDAGEGNSTSERCVKSSDCASGYCEAGACGLAPEGYFCDSDTDCVSGVCSNGQCKKPTLSQSITYFISQYFGGDSTTKNFIALIIILGITLTIGFYLRSAALAVITFYSLSILMVLLSLLSIFVFFVFVIAGIVVTFVGIYLSQK